MKTYYPGAPVSLSHLPLGRTSAPPLRRIVVDPQVMLGKPVIQGTRITVGIVLEKLAAGIPIDEILGEYPSLTRQDVFAALAYARQALGTDEVLPRVAGRR